MERIWLTNVKLEVKKLRRDALALGERLLQEREAAGTAPDNAESTSSKDSAQNTDMSGTSEVIDRADK